MFIAGAAVLMGSNPMFRLYLEKLLQAAENIEEINWTASFNTPTIYTATAFGNTGWPESRDVDLRYFDVTMIEIKDFITRHAHCTRYLPLKNFNLLTGCFGEALQYRGK